MRLWLPAAVLSGIFCSGSAGHAQAAQPAPAAQPAAPPQATPTPEAAAPAAAPQPAAASAQNTHTVPAGTKILLQMRSAINTKSAKPGDGVYLASTFPVVVGNRVAIPVGVYVQGVVDRVQRASHEKGKAELDMHFTSIIFPNGSVVEIPGVVDNLPGASKQTVEKDGEGTIQQDPDKTRNAAEVAKISVPTGAGVGSLSGLANGHPLAGGLAGIGAGLATAGLVSLFTRGADVNIEAGTQVEMVLQRPLILQDENFAPTGSAGAPTAMTPSPDQPKPMQKPAHGRVFCPPGGLGCD